MRSEAKQRQAGFTLVEVLAAFVIAALATIVLLRAGFASAGTDQEAAQMQQATARAQSRLASVGVLTPLREEHLSGEDGSGYAWTLSVSRLNHRGKLSLYAVVLSERHGRRSVTLRTAMLGMGP